MREGKVIRFNFEKNEKLKVERGVSFEDVLMSIEAELVVDDLKHTNEDK